jgi:hypothetical protein
MAWLGYMRLVVVKRDQPVQRAAGFSGGAEGGAAVDTFEAGG